MICGNDKVIDIAAVTPFIMTGRDSERITQQQISFLRIIHVDLDMRIIRRKLIRCAIHGAVGCPRHRPSVRPFVRRLRCQEIAAGQHLVAPRRRAEPSFHRRPAWNHMSPASATKQHLPPSLSLSISSSPLQILLAAHTSGKTASRVRADEFRRRRRGVRSRGSLTATGCHVWRCRQVLRV